jgi:hypothetical protein
MRMSQIRGYKQNNRGTVWPIELFHRIYIHILLVDEEEDKDLDEPR